MRLHHVTYRKHCASIAEHGFRDSHRIIDGVHLSPPDRLWVDGGFSDLDFTFLDPDQVAFAFEVPDEVAALYELREDVPTLEAPGDDIPENLDDDPAENWDCSAWPVYEYVIPAEVVNRYCLGPVHWTGEPPLTAGQFVPIVRRWDASVTEHLAQMVFRGETLTGKKPVRSLVDWPPFSWGDAACLLGRVSVEEMQGLVRRVSDRAVAGDVDALRLFVAMWMTPPPETTAGVASMIEAFRELESRT